MTKSKSELIYFASFIMSVALLVAVIGLSCMIVAFQLYSN